jgi:glucose-6-phosphate-specific signal transduction histidine kinase
MGKGILENRWVRQLAVALGYALVYSVIRPFSTTYWPIVYGLRVACLLLIPRRYWLSLAVGELVPLTYFNAECLNDFGLTWVVLNSIPRIALGMPVVWWFRSKAKLFPSRGLVDIKLLWYCTLALSALWASASYAVLMTVRLPAGPYIIRPGTAFMYLLDIYVTQLAVVPWAIMIRIRGRKEARRIPPLRAWRFSLLTRDTITAVLTLTALAFLHYVADNAIKPIIMTSMFLPAVWLTFKHGWKASVLCGTLSLICACLLTEWKPDASVQQTQFLMATAVTCLYIFGARISAQWHQHEQVTRDARETQGVAQSALVFGEQRLQQTSQALECMAGILRVDHAHMLERFVPAAEQNEYGKQAQQLQQQVYRLAENIHPSAWRERGLAAALDETIGEVLEDANIAYVCETPGRGLRFLSPALQAAIYRIVCEVVARFSASPASERIHLDIRIGHRDHVRWVALRIRSVENQTSVAHAMLHARERYRVAPKLGASMKSFDELQRLARLFDGKLRRRSITNGIRVSVMLFDDVTQTTHQTLGATPIRLWVR